MHGQGGDENIAEGGFLLEDFRNEPQQTKGLIRIRQLVLAFEKDHLTRPQGAKFGLVHELNLRLRHAGIEHGELASIRRASANHDHKCAVGQPRHQGKHPVLRQDAGPRQALNFGLQADVAGHAQEQIVLGFFRAERVFGHQPLRVDLHAMVQGNGRQALHCSVGKIHAHEN